MKYMTAVLTAAVFLLALRTLPVDASSARACVLMESATGRVLYAENAEERLPMASTTKIMTALLTLESGDLDTEFTVDSAAIHVEGSSMGLSEGDTVTKRVLCTGMLLPSGNDAANAAAVAVAGSIPSFAERMNARAAAVGMTNSCFVTPSGLDEDGHGASAHDMALLAREAMQNPEFREICGKQSAVVNFGNPPYARTLYNTNKLLKQCEGVIGIKTGFTDEAGRCLVSACQRDGVELLCVTLHDADDWNDHAQLYELGFSMVQKQTLPVPESVSQTVMGGTAGEVMLIPEEYITAGIPENTADITYRIRKKTFVYAPVNAGEELGTLEYLLDGRVFARVALTAAESVEMETKKPSEHLFDRLHRWFENQWKS